MKYITPTVSWNPPPQPDAETSRAYQTLVRVSQTHHKLFHEIHTFSPRFFLRPHVFTIPAPTDQDGIDDAIWRGIYSTHILMIRSQDIMAKTNKFLTDSGLEEPFSSSPTRPPRYGISINSLDGSSHRSWSNFYGIYAAKRWVEDIIADNKTNWTDDNTMIVPSLQIEIKSEIKPDGLTQIMEHEYTTQEKQWEMPEPYATQILRIRNPGTYVEIAAERAQRRERNAEAQSGTKSSKQRPERAPRREKAPKKRTDDLISLPDVLAGTDISAKEARTILRKIAYPKPDAGWAFTSDEAPKVLKAIKDNRK